MNGDCHGRTIQGLCVCYLARVKRTAGSYALERTLTVAVKFRKAEHARGPDRVEMVMPRASIFAWGFSAYEIGRVELSHHFPKEGSREARALKRVGDLYLLNDEHRLFECAVGIVNLRNGLFQHHFGGPFGRS